MHSHKRSQYVIIIVLVMAVPSLSHAQTVVHHPQPDRPLNEGFGWAMEAAGPRSFWVGYSVDGLMEEGRFLLIGEDYTLLTSTPQQQGAASLHRLIYGQPPATISEEESVRQVAERALAELDRQRRPEKVEKEIALLFHYRAEAQGADQFEGLRVTSVRLPVDLEGEPLYWLGTTDPEQSLALLQRYYAEARSVTLKERLIGAIGAHGRPALVVPFLTKVLTSQAEAEIREEAASWLGYQDDDRVIPILLTAVQEDRALEVREEAAEGIGSVHSEAAIDALIEIMHEAEDAEVREQAVEGLAWRRSEKAVKELKRVVFDDGSEEVQEEALDALAQQAGADRVPFLTEVVRTHPHMEVQEEAVDWLGEIGSDEALATLEDVVFEGRTIDVQEEAVEALARLAQRQGGPRLVKIVRTHQRPDIREEAIKALVALEVEGLPSVLERIAFEDASIDVQEEAVEALGALPDGAGIDGLINVMTNHARASIREEAVEQLDEQQDPRARRAVRNMLEEAIN